jgi:protein-serine/threonine kinase
MYEVLIGRTPFEADEEEQFDTADELVVYHERTKKGVWVGQWFMPHGMSD